MKLRYSLGSPFARKPVIAAHVLGLVGRLELIDHAADPDNAVRHINPLHKIPMLVADNDVAIFDSPVILEYLDELAGGGKIIPASGLARYRTLSRLALADGIADAGVLIMNEMRHHEGAAVSQKWIDLQRGKIKRALDAFENELPESFDAAAMGLFCALAFLSTQDWDWRAHAPKVAAWFDHVKLTEPSIAATEPR